MQLCCACCVLRVLPHAAMGLAGGMQLPGAAGSSPPPLEVDPPPTAGPPVPPLPMLVTPLCPESVICCKERLPAVTQVAQVDQLTAAAGHWVLTRGLPVATSGCIAWLPAATQNVHFRSQSASGARWMMPSGTPNPLLQPYRWLQGLAAAQAVLNSKHCHLVLAIHQLQEYAAA